MTGVPSIASSGPTRIRCFSTASTRTRWSPTGFGRSGERVEKTPVSGREGSLRGWTSRTDRSASWNQVRTRSSSPRREGRGGPRHLRAKLDPRLGRTLVTLHGGELAVPELGADDSDRTDDEVGPAHERSPKSAFTSGYGIAPSSIAS
jgi:hypothetical protein